MVRGFVGHTESLGTTFAALVERLAGQPELDPDGWGSAFVTDPWPRPLPADLPASTRLRLRQHYTAQQPERVRTLTFVTRSSESLVAIEDHEGALVLAITYAAGRAAAAEAGASSSLPSDSPLPLVGAGQGEGSPDGTAPSPSLSRERERGRSSLLQPTAAAGSATDGDLAAATAETTAESTDQATDLPTDLPADVRAVVRGLPFAVAPTLENRLLRAEPQRAAADDRVITLLGLAALWHDDLRLAETLRRIARLKADDWALRAAGIAVAQRKGYQLLLHELWAGETDPELHAELTALLTGEPASPAEEAAD